MSRRSDTLYWERFLRDLCRGEQGFLVDEHGSIESVVTANARRRGGADASLPDLRRALDQLLLSWRVREKTRWTSSSLYEALVLVELIAAFTPGEGPNRLIPFLRLPTNSFEQSVSLDADGAIPVNIRRRALVVLSHYFQSPGYTYDEGRRQISDKESPLFAAYVDILRNHLSYPDCEAVAGEELIRLGKIQKDDEWPLMLPDGAFRELCERIARHRDYGQGADVFEDVVSTGSRPRLVEQYMLVTAQVTRDEVNRLGAKEESVWGR